MSEENKAVVRRFYEEVENQGNLDLIDELIAPDFKDVFNSSIHGPVRGRDGMRNLVTKLREMAGFHIQIDDLIAEGDKVVLQMPKGAEVLRVADGMLQERWVYIDRAAH